MKTELKNLLRSSHTNDLSKGTIFYKNAYFFVKNADISNIKEVLVLQGIFFETTYVLVLTTKFEVWTIILKSFRRGRGVVLPPPLP